MAQDTKDKARKIAGGVGHSSPLIVISKAIGDIGEKVAEHAPEGVRKVGRKIARGAVDLLEEVPAFKRRLSRGIRKAVKTTRKTARKISRGRRSSGSRR